MASRLARLSDGRHTARRRTVAHPLLTASGRSSGPWPTAHGQIRKCVAEILRDLEDLAEKTELLDNLMDHAKSLYDSMLRMNWDADEADEEDNADEAWEAW